MERLHETTTTIREVFKKNRLVILQAAVQVTQARCWLSPCEVVQLELFYCV